MAEFQNFNLAQIYGAADQANALRNQQQFQQYQIQRQQRDDQRADAGRNAYAITPDGTLDEGGTFANLMRVDPSQALQFKQTQAKAKSEQAKATREESKAALEQKKATFEYLKDRLSTVTDDASHQAFLQEAAQLAPELAKTAPTSYNQDWQRSNLLTADKAISQLTPKYERVDRGGKIEIVDMNPFTNPAIKGMQLDKVATIGEQESARHNRVAEGISGAQLGVSRDRLAFDKSGGVSGVNASNPKPEKLTEGMRTAAEYAQRMAAAEMLLDNTVEQKPGILETIAGGTPFIGNETSANLARSPDRQKSLQAQRDWVRAKLRKESGAAIGVDEMKNEITTYFPQIGDSQEVVDQKKLARQQAVDGLIQSSGSAYKAPSGAILPKDAKMPPKIKPGKVEDGYVYLGGDPAKPTSWKKAK